MKHIDYDIAIVGGGLGGLSLSILMARQGARVALFEKETYPFHRVCGEYISNESYDFVRHLGVDLSGIPLISRLEISSQKGKVLRAKLPLGGFGISRYTLDHRLAVLAQEAGVDLYDGARVDQVIDNGETFQIKSRKGEFSSQLVVSAHGKKSNLDVKLKRSFTQRSLNASNNYVGVKYHVRHPDFPSDLIELMNFQDGYCGMSQIEDEKYCLCYLTTAASLRENGNSIAQLEANVLMKNPILADRLTRSERLFQEPVTVSNVNFIPKSVIEGRMLMLGDAAGSIAPLAGNGMSMSLHAAWILHGLLNDYLQGKISLDQLQSSYTQRWQKLFLARIRMGSRLQKLFGKAGLTEVSIGSLRYLPFITRQLIRLTHGKPFFSEANATDNRVSVAQT